MASSWNKGLTKLTHKSVQKISETMRSKKIDNFKLWREKMRREGRIKTSYSTLKKDGDLAELIGVVLGDGHICLYPRTEELRLISHASNRGFIDRYAGIMERIFDKKPYIINSKQSHTTKIGFYEKHISERLGIPIGARRHTKVRVPGWILRKKQYILRYLRGLYEAEGSLSFHPGTYTHKFIFKNRNDSMLDNVFVLVKKIGFTPHRSEYMIQVSKKDEVSELTNLIEFRKY